MFREVVEYIQTLYKTKDFIPLHEPRFRGNEKKYLIECIDSTFVSSVGKYVDDFEAMVAKYTGSPYAVAAVNGTAALQIALILAGVKNEDEVITQSLTFIASANAISHIGASPIFVDVDRETLGLSPESLKTFLEHNTTIKDGICINKKTGRRITACVPMHTFGHACAIDEIVKICDCYNIKIVEDAAESLGTLYDDKHTGRFGLLGVLSFNGNKIITTGGGGIILTADKDLAQKAKHLTTTAKVPHPYEFVHDEIGYNYRLTNIAAALGCAQMEQLDAILESKRNIAEQYKSYFSKTEFEFFSEPPRSMSNYWLNAILCKDLKQRNEFLEFMAENNVMCRPVWRLLNTLNIYSHCQTAELDNSNWLANRIVNIPSSSI